MASRKETDRIGRNGRFLGKRDSDSDLHRLDEPAKKRLLEISGIKDDYAEEEREELLKALLASNPDFLKLEEERQDRDKDSGDSSNSPTDWTAGLNQQPTLNADNNGNYDGDDDEDDDDATQPPEQIVVDSDADSSSSKGQDGEGRAGSNKHGDKPEAGDRQGREESDSDEHEEAGNCQRGANVKPATIEDEEQRDAKPGCHRKDKSQRSHQPVELVGADVNSSDSGEDGEEETQAYDIGKEQWVQETQRSEERVVTPTGPPIPESPSWESDVEDTQLPDSRLEKELTGKSPQIISPLQNSHSKQLLQNLNPLWASLCCPDTVADDRRDCYTQAVKLMFDLYMRRVCREQRRLAQAVSWGKPVETGPHVEGCMRSKRGARRMMFPQTEVTSLKEHVLRRGRTAAQEGKASTDPYVPNVLGNENDDDDDFEKESNLALKELAQTRTLAEDEHVSTELDLVAEGSSRKSARLGTLKLKEQKLSGQVLASESADSDGDEEWDPGQTKSRPRKRKQAPRKKGQKPCDSSPHEGKDGGNITKSLGFIKRKGRKTAGENVRDVNKENSNFEEETCDVKSRQRGETSAPDASELEAASKPHPIRRRYKFSDHSSDGDSNLELEKPTTSNNMQATHKARQDSVDNCIVVSDSDQSNDIGGGDLYAAGPVHSGRASRQREKNSGLSMKKSVLQRNAAEVARKSNSTTDAGSSRKKQIVRDINKPVDEIDSDIHEDCCLPHPTEAEAKGPEVQVSCSSPAGSMERTPSPLELPSPAEGNVLSSQHSLDDVASCSQSSSYLLDRDGQLYSTQFDNRPKKSHETRAQKSKGKQLLQKAPRSEPESKGDMPKPEGEMENPISLSSSSSKMENPRKRKFVAESGATKAKRQAHSVEEVDDSDDSNFAKADLKQADSGSSTKANVELVDSASSVNTDVQMVICDDDDDDDDEEKSNSVAPLRKTRRRRAQNELTSVMKTKVTRGRKAPPSSTTSRSVPADREGESSEETSEPARPGNELARSESEEEREADRWIDDRQSDHGELQPPVEELTDKTVREDPPVQSEESLREDLTAEVDEQALSLCPICNKEFALIDIEAHASTCGEEEILPEQEEPQPLCLYCQQPVAEEELREHQRNCAKLVQAEGSGDGASGKRVTRSRRGDQDPS